MNPWEKLGMVGVIIIAAGIILILALTARASGAVDYCYIHSSSSPGVPHAYYELIGHRPWRPDPTMGIFDSFDMAAEAATKAGCKLSQ